MIHDEDVAMDACGFTNERHDETFCQNSFSEFDFTSPTGQTKQRLSEEVSKKACMPLGSERLPPSKHSVRGEEPADEMRKKGLGEEPRLAFQDLKHSGHKMSDIYVLELFAGTARLTRCLKQKGFQAMAFDRSSKRSENQHVLEADLSNKGEVESLLSFIRLKAGFIAYIHMAPPCGTASRARGKRLKFLQRHNIKEPMPLRDDQFPDGFPWLSGSDKLRTETANILYSNTVLIAQTAVELSIAICIENPSNSLMWKTSPFQHFFAENPSLRFVNFHNCAHGGTRDKKTCFVTNVDWFDSLEQYCNKQHSHAPWTPTVANGRVSFPTHAEAAYPEVLCNRIASLLKQKVLQMGAIEVSDLAQHVQSHGKSLNRVVLGALPRGKHVRPLVSEYGAYISVITAVQCDLELNKFLQQLPKGATIQSRLLSTWGEMREAIAKQTKKRMLEKKLLQTRESQGVMTQPDPYDEVYAQFGCVADSTYKILVEGYLEMDDSDACERVTVAIPRDPMDFLCRAVQVGHPRSVALQLPPALQEVVGWNRDASAYVIHKHRTEFVRKWSNRAMELKGEDARLLRQAPEHLQRILAGKRLALWQEMLTYYEYPDKDLISDIVNGFPLTGWLPDSSVFPKDFKPPNMDVHTLQSLSLGINERVKAKVMATNSSEMLSATWEETEKELREGWMQVDETEGKGASWAMRFGLQQREKVRVIDDFSIAGVNHTAGLQERLKIFGIDDIAALVAYSLDTFDGEVHPPLLGKTMDLKSAYKQFGVCMPDRDRIRVATCRPDTLQFVLLLVNALPFGATGSVSGFLRVSMFLWFIGLVGLRLAWTCFYDDYTMISRSDCANNAAWSAECLFDLLGVLYAKEGKKAAQFDKVFGSLGVVFDLSLITKGTFSLNHTEMRRTELAEVIAGILSDGCFTGKMIERLRGRMLWFENFVCGRQANVLVARLGKFVSGAKFSQLLPLELKDTLKQLLERVQKSTPIEISTRLFSTWICFTDGACEKRSSVGAVLVDPTGKAVYTFGGELPAELEERFFRNSKHPIYEVELLPVLISLLIWGESFSRSQVVYYVDNEAAKAGLIRGAGGTSLANVIIGTFCLKEAELQLKTWFSRVPTHSNLSDGPSRMDFNVVTALGCAKVEIPWAMVIKVLDAHHG